MTVAWSSPTGWTVDDVAATPSAVASGTTGLALTCTAVVPYLLGGWRSGWGREVRALGWRFGTQCCWSVPHHALEPLVLRTKA